MTHETRSFRSPLAAILGVVVEPRSYARAFYSLIAFPLGTLYFVFLVVGLSLGVGLVLLWIGFLILAFVLVAAWGLSAFERRQAIWLLDADVPTMRRQAEGERDLWEVIRVFVSNPVTWKGPLFLLIKFPLGIFSFVVMLTSFCLGLSLLLAPAYYLWAPIDFFYWYADTLPEALLCSLSGAAVLVVTLHLGNALGWLWRQLAVHLLGSHLPGHERLEGAAV